MTQNKQSSKKNSSTTTSTGKSQPSDAAKPARKSRSRKQAMPAKSKTKQAASSSSGSSTPTSEKPAALAPNPAPKPVIIHHDLLLNALPHPVIVLRPDNTFMYANAAAEAFLSTSMAMLKRLKLDEIVAFGCPLLSLAEQVRNTRQTVNEYGIDIETPRLTAPKLVDVNAGPLPESPDHVVLMLQQRTMAQMIERQFTHRAAARSVSGMAGILAHEIKNPLSGIRGAAQLLEQDMSDDDRALTQLICSETDRIRGLLDRMEVFGDERPLAKEPVNIHDVLDHVRQLAVAGFARNIEVVAEYDPSLPAIPASRDKLIQAVLNLVKNAAESIGPENDNGRIVITTAFRPGVRLSIPGTGTRISLPLMIEIQDNGPGVPDTILEHMFDPFVTSKASGTGLGLALVAKLIADHGGIIECDSEPEKTIFRILLPMQDIATAKATKPTD